MAASFGANARHPTQTTAATPAMDSGTGPRGASPPDRAALIERGNAALAIGAWAEARAAYELALAQGETADAYERLSWAAWWLNDGDLAIRGRETAYRLYRQEGDDRAAARMAIWISSDYEDFRGELAIARGWRRRARRLLAPLPLAPEHGWLRLFESEAALLLDADPVAARRHAEAAGAIGRDCGIADIEIMAMAVQGLALVDEGVIDEGMARLDEAAAAALGGEIRDDIWINRAVCYLIFACERVRDFNRAAQWCAKMRELADRMRYTFAQGICRMHYAGVLISRGNWSEAEAQLAEATAMLDESRPPYAVEGTVRLAELRRRQGRLDDALRIFRQVEWHPLALLGLAEIALDTAQPREAEELIQRFLRHMPEPSRLQRAAALELLIRIEALLGKYAQAATTLTTLHSISEAVATAPLRAATAFSAGMMAIAQNDLERGKTLLEDALDLFVQSGTPYEAARARLELASVLVSLHRFDRARAEAAVAQQQLTRLGSHFFSQRAAALLREIDQRLARAEPGPSVGTVLTERQVEVLRLIAQGMSDRDIAAALSLSEHTIHRHVANILIRLNQSTRAAAVADAAGRGLLP